MLAGWVIQWRTTGATGWNTAVVELGDEESGGSHNLTTLDTDQEYEVRVAAFHDTVVKEAPTSGRVTYVLAAEDAGTLMECQAKPTGSCYVLIREASMDDPGSIGPYTDVAKATTGAEQLPGAPQNLRLIPGDQSITVQWDAPQNLGNPELDGYVVRWAQAGTTDWKYLAAASVDPNLIITDMVLDGLTNGTEYEVQVAAFHKTAIAATADVEVVYVVNANHVPAPEAGQDRLQPCPTGSEPDADCHVVIKTASMDDPGNIGPYADAATATPQALPSILAASGDGRDVDPAAPRNLVLIPAAGQITVTWDAPDPEEAPDNHAGYIVQYRKVGSTTWTEWQRIIGRMVLRATITGLEKGSYEVRVGTLICEAYCDDEARAIYASGSFSAPRRAEADAVRAPGPVRNLEALIKVFAQRRLAVPPGLLGRAHGRPRQPAGHRGLLGAVQAGRGLRGLRLDRLDGEALEHADQALGRDTRHRVRTTTGRRGWRPSASPTWWHKQYVYSGLVHRSPSAIRDLTLTPGDGQIEVTWNPPEDPGNPPIWEYIVSYRRGRLPHLAAVPAAGEQTPTGPSPA